MIQRIQTVWLILIVALLVTFIFFPLLSSGAPAEFELGLLSLATLDGIWLVLLIAGYALILLCIYFAISGIMSFKNRKKQMSKIRILQTLLVVVIIWISGVAYTASQSDMQWKFEFVVLIPIASMVLSALAYRGVQNDEKLIRSVDRLR
ncbi:MAG TPA: hypothetical protein DDX92_13060 [Flavobacteriales bacterium]|jgi:peptidoglycan/LPS O-acetylase OafA/YrhL|nr:hypothetical protein [Flavobacteriales bacterium]